MCTDLHLKCPLFLSDLNEISLFSTCFRENTEIWNILKICPVEGEFFHADGQTDGRTDHPILIFRPPFLLTSSSTTVRPPIYTQAFVVVSLYNPDDGDRRISKVLVLLFHKTRRRAQEDWHHQHHYGNLKSRTAKWKCFVVRRFGLDAKDAVVTFGWLITRIFLWMIPPLFHSRPWHHGRHWTSGWSSQLVLLFRVQEVQVTNLRPVSDCPHWGVFSSVPPSKCRDMRDFRLSPRCI